MRQLQNVIRQIVVLNEGTTVEHLMFPHPLIQIQSSSAEKQYKCDNDSLIYEQNDTRRESTLLLNESSSHSIKPLWLVENKLLKVQLLCVMETFPKLPHYWILAHQQFTGNE